MTNPYIRSLMHDRNPRTRQLGRALARRTPPDLPQELARAIALSARIAKTATRAPTAATLAKDDGGAPPTGSPGIAADFFTPTFSSVPRARRKLLRETDNSAPTHTSTRRL